MRLTYLKSLLLVFVMLSGCSENKTGKSSDGTNEEFYPDGTYCADVTYYNPNTQRQSEYTMNVEVENGQLTKILWSNGGWLDVSHFTSLLSPQVVIVHLPQIKDNNILFQLMDQSI